MEPDTSKGASTSGEQSTLPEASLEFKDALSNEETLASKQGPFEDDNLTENERAVLALAEQFQLCNLNDDYISPLAYRKGGIPLTDDD